MKKEPKNTGRPSGDDASAPAMPAVADRAAFQAGLYRMRVREKAHPRR